tara:strand:+ start:1288 stop:1632 length:345 start_codon:yes stop_codon:yes gene_type:complete
MIEFAHSKWIGALITLIINMGSSYVVSDVQHIFKGVFRYKFMKWLVVFAICFASTKDVYVSICLSLLFSIIVWIVLENKANNIKYSLPRIKKTIKTNIKDFLLSIKNNESESDS